MLRQPDARLATDLPIYLDHNATTPLDPTALAAMMPYLTGTFGNPSSKTHAYGWAADEAVTGARREVAGLIGAEPKGVVFTSGATESNVLALRGLAARFKRGHLITSVVEHKSVLACCQELAEEGFRVTYLTPGRDGLVTVEQVLAAVEADTFLVSLMLVNNEVGTINPIAEIGRALKERGVYLHCDAAQAASTVAIAVERAGIDLLSLSAHKVYGPKGVGALYVSERVRPLLAPLMRGGGQEGGLRGGTLNVPGIVGFGRACAVAAESMPSEPARLAGLRDRLLAKLRDAVPELIVNGSLVARVAGNLSVTFPGVDGEALLTAVNRRLAVSSGSACSAGSGESSYVLVALGVEPDHARATLRFGLGRSTTVAEIDLAAELIGREVARLRRPQASAPGAEPTAAPRLTSAPTVGDLHFIGTVRNAQSEPRYIEWGRVTSRLEIDAEWESALKSLEDYSHIVVVFWMHATESCKLEHVPQARYQDVPKVGIFACRCSTRPNPIGITTVRLVARDGRVLIVEGLDAIDGTPVLDLKPYTPQMDEASGGVRVPGWVEKLTY